MTKEEGAIVTKFHISDMSEVRHSEVTHGITTSKSPPPTSNNTAKQLAVA